MFKPNEGSPQNLEVVKTKENLAQEIKSLTNELDTIADIVQTSREIREVDAAKELYTLKHDKMVREYSVDPEILVSPESIDPEMLFQREIAATEPDKRNVVTQFEIQSYIALPEFSQMDFASPEEESAAQHRMLEKLESLTEKLDPNNESDMRKKFSIGVTKRNIIDKQPENILSTNSLSKEKTYAMLESNLILKKKRGEIRDIADLEEYVDIFANEWENIDALREKQYSDNDARLQTELNQIKNAPYATPEILQRITEMQNERQEKSKKIAAPEERRAI